jgi:transposase InsO family protein
VNASAPAPPDQTDAASAFPSQLLTVEALRRPLESAHYTSHAFGHVLDDHGVLGSIGSVGDAYDNALAESFVDSFKTELIADRVWHPLPARARDRRVRRLVQHRPTARVAR